MELRISKGLQAVALATGIGQESFQQDTSFRFIHPRFHQVLIEKIGPPLIMIGCDRLYVHIQRVQAMLHAQNTRVKLDEPSMYRHGLGTQETERSNMSHVVDMINIKMFTIETTSTHVMIGLELVDLDHITLE